ncbi:MAG: Nif3-like dinuclear metal center hexameric protein [Gammaproteobacteria bacterium]
MVELKQLERYCNELLQIESISDYCPNGLQVDVGVEQIQRIVTGVTASQALLDAAVERCADLLLVHHGYFWKGEQPALVGIKGRRIGTLYRGNVSLMAYHLPLDVHKELGNNRMLAQRFGFDAAAPVEPGDGLLWTAELSQPESIAQITERIILGLGREPLYLPGGGAEIRRVGWCSGGAEDYINQAAEHGVDAFISGEVSEPTMHLARELGVHFFSAGHHATERFGIQALGEHLARSFDLEHCFIDLPNPV